MMAIVILLVAVYVVAALLFSRRLVLWLQEELEDKIKVFDQRHKLLVEKKDFLLKKKLKLEEEASQIFTLYDITKEITKNFNREDAVRIFNKKLKEHVYYEECIFLDPLSNQYKELKDKEGYYLFTIKEKNKRIGCFALKGVNKDDYEKINILGNQFALALRRIDLYQELERVAITDSLTELNTRRHIFDRLREEFDRSKARKINLSFLMIDVDFFKRYNDKYGHITGDQILREIGFIIRDNIREIDIAGRYGGEEFCVILPDTNGDGAKYAAERIRQAAEKAVIKAYDAKVGVTVSIGVSTYPDHAKNIDELMDKADWALYRAKKLGRNRICAFGQYSD